MTDRETQRAFGYAKIALNLLRKSAIPPLPHLYELLYTYASSANTELNQRINTLFRSGALPSREMAESLYHEFFHPTVTERISRMSVSMNKNMGAVNVALDSAMETAEHFSAKLNDAWRELEAGPSSPNLKKVASRLLSETERMQDTNLQLSEQLALSRDAIKLLQQELADLRREAALDPLTKLANRSHFDECLGDHIATSRKTGEPLCVVIVDIDHFKAFNDNYGHLTGDQVLRLVAMQMQQNLPQEALAARFGGEEFSAILPSTDLRSAIFAAENIRCAIEKKQLLRISTNERLGFLTASVGVALLNSADTAETLVRRADECLYHAKRAGRNRVICEDEVHAPEFHDITVNVA